jgi:hypothetical protein
MNAKDIVEENETVEILVDVLRSYFTKILLLLQATIICFMAFTYTVVTAEIIVKDIFIVGISGLSLLYFAFRISVNVDNFLASLTVLIYYYKSGEYLIE